MINIARRLISTVLAIVLTTFVGGTKATYDVRDSENIKLNFVVVSDIHMEGNNSKTRNIAIKSFRAMKNCTTQNDALVTVGDNVMNGQNIEYLFLHGIINNIKPAEKYYLGLGNHEIGNGNNKYSYLSKRFVSYSQTYTDKSIDKVYYYEIINGCYFIFLGSEEDISTSEYIYNDELDWLDGVLKEATASKKPIFVFNHHPFGFISNYEGSERLEKILTDYDNIFYFTGHTHWQLDYETVEYIDNVNKKTPYILMPCFKDDYNETEIGVGAQVEVYDDSVSIRFRAYATDTWIDGYDYEFPITK